MTTPLQSQLSAELESMSTEPQSMSTSPQQRSFPFLRSMSTELQSMSTSPQQGQQRLFPFLRSSVRPSGDKKPRQKPPRTVSWSTHVEVLQLTSRSVTWNTHIEVRIIPARDNSPDENFEGDEHTTVLSCKDDTLAPCTGRSDNLTACAALETKRDTVG